MQHGRYSEATSLYKLVLKNCCQKMNYYRDILHAKCASILEKGLFIDAQKMWKEAKILCPNHNGIELQAQK
jgi:hypothetical protein